MSQLRITAALAAVLLLAGCGGQSALRQEAKNLQSLAAEGGLLAGDAARGRSTSVFTREHAGFLVAAAKSSATTLAQGPRPLAKVAARVSDDLDRLARSGSNRAEQRRLSADLTRAAKAVAKLGQSL